MVRLVPFIYNTTTTYKVEFGNLYARFFYGDSVLVDGNSSPVVITTPYLSADLNSLHIKQLGDTMWIVHPSYAPRKLTRVSSTSFSLDVIPLNNGPFMLRNDLIDPTVVNTAYLIYTGTTTKGSVGTLSCCKKLTTTYNLATMTTANVITITSAVDLTSLFPSGSTFQVAGNSYPANNTQWTVSTTSYVGTTFTINTVEHIWGTANGSGTTSRDSAGIPISYFNVLQVGSLFRLTTTRTNTVSTPNTLAAVGVICNPIYVKGTYTFTTSAFTSAITGTIVLERSENGADWEIIRSDTTNIVYSAVEENDNVQYRARVTAVSGGTLTANITVVDTTMSGIVRVTGYTSPYVVSVVVLSDLDATTGVQVTKRWAEGEWSPYRTWPTSVTFYEDRCIYAGMATIPTQVTYGGDILTKLLCHFDGADAAVATVDDSASAHTPITFVGTAQLDTAQYKFSGTASLLLDGNSDYLTIPTSPDWDFGTDEFTIDAWVRLNAYPSTSAHAVIVARYQDDDNYYKFSLYYDGTTGKLMPHFYGAMATVGFNIHVNPPITFSTGAWHHVAVTRSKDNVTFFVDGVKQVSYNTNTIAGISLNPTGVLSIGAINPAGADGYFNGWIDELRISKGVTRWTETFTPPTVAY